MADRFASGERWFVAAVVVCGTGAATVGIGLQPPELDPRTLVMIVLAAFAGLLKVPLPVRGSLSLAYTFVLATMMGFGLGASVLAGILSVGGSALISARDGGRATLHQTAFNAGLVALACVAAGGAYLLLGGPVGSPDLKRALWPVLGYTATFAVVNVGMLSLVLRLSDGEQLKSSLQSTFQWSIPGYLAGSALATMLVVLQAEGNLLLLILGAPFLYLVRASYRIRAAKSEQDRLHTQQTAQLYSSITEALAVAIEAKDGDTEAHLQRVRHYCQGIGELLGLERPQMEALKAAALLHDIGKIAVPEYILTKPGRLTADEMERMKVHPAVGADILDRVPFPFPLAPIVRHHHERWDGEGYPDGLAGEQIPLGARILAVVDCYDALTSDRHYRKALTKKEALAYMKQQAGRIFDPQLVELLVANVKGLESQVREAAPATAVERLPEPIRTDNPGETGPSDVARVIEELQRVAEAMHDRLRPEERLARLTGRLQDLIPYRSLVVYTLDSQKDVLVASYCVGQADHRLSGLVIPVGEKLAGWTVANQRPFRGEAHVNAIERDGSRFDLEDLFGDPAIDELRSAAVVPLSGERGRLGALALYHGEDFKYSIAHVDLLVAAADQFVRELGR